MSLFRNNRVQKLFNDASSEINQKTASAKKEIYNRIGLTDNCQEFKINNSKQKRHWRRTAEVAVFACIIILIGVIYTPKLFNQISMVTNENSTSSGLNTSNSSVDAQVPNITSGTTSKTSQPITNANNTTSKKTETPITSPTQSPSTNDSSQITIAGDLPAGLLKTSLDELASDTKLKYLLGYIPKTFPYDMRVASVWRGDPQKKQNDLYVLISNDSQYIMYTIFDIPAGASLMRYTDVTGARIKEQATILNENRALCSSIIVKDKAIGIDANIGVKDQDFNAIANMIASLK